MDQQTKLRENLVLIGSTNYDYVESLKAFIQNKGPVWSSWNFKIRNEWRSVISDRIRVEIDRSIKQETWWQRNDRGCGGGVRYSYE